MSVKWKSWLLLGGIFVVGAVTGAALTIGFGAHFRHAPGEQEMRIHWMFFLTKQLDLTADQQAKIQPILDDAGNQLQNLHRDEIDKGAQIFKDTDDKISALLTPDQKAKLQQLENEREKMFMSRPRPWSHEGPGGGPGGGPGMFHHWGDEGQPPPPPSGDTNLPPPPMPPSPGGTNAPPPAPPGA